MAAEWSLESIVRSLCLKKTGDVLDNVHYHFTGQLLMGDCAPDDRHCSNAMFSSLAYQEPAPIHNQSVYHTIDMASIRDFWWMHGNLLEAHKSMLKNKIGQLRKLAIDGLVQVNLMHGLVNIKDNYGAMRILAKLHPDSVSWNNCLDYFETPKLFHDTARAIGPSCTHYGYSMNWPNMTAGNAVFEYNSAKERQKQLKKSSKLISGLKCIYNLKSQHTIKFNPLILLVSNFGSAEQKSFKCSSRYQRLHELKITDAL